MKRTIILSAFLVLITGIYGQTVQEKSQASLQETKEKVKASLQETQEALVKWDTETLLDSLDQEELPKLVSGGVLAGANLSNFIISRDHHAMSSYMRIGAELGGFIDFSLSKHFAIQPQVLFTAHQNYFAVKEGDDVFKLNGLWSFGMEIPIYFLGRFGNLRQGYVQFGGGIFTHFTFASNTGKYKNADQPITEETTTPIPKKANSNNTTVFNYDYSRLYTLHNNHFGVCATVGYEFKFGMQINLHYKVSLSDIAGFYSEMKGQDVAKAVIYPQSISLTVGYRWR